MLLVSSHFSMSTNRADELKEFCEWLEVGFLLPKRHGKTRWLTPLPAVERIIFCYPALKSYFLSQSPRNCPKAQREFFAEPISEVYLSFLQSALSQFQKANLRLQKETLSVPETHHEMRQLLHNLEKRKEAKFYRIRQKP